jgi:hypothetical protein
MRFAPPPAARPTTPNNKDRRRVFSSNWLACQAAAGMSKGPFISGHGGDWPSPPNPLSSSLRSESAGEGEPIAVMGAHGNVRPIRQFVMKRPLEYPQNVQPCGDEAPDPGGTPGLPSSRSLSCFSRADRGTVVPPGVRVSPVYGPLCLRDRSSSDRPGDLLQLVALNDVGQSRRSVAMAWVSPVR